MANHRENLEDDLVISEDGQESLENRRENLEHHQESLEHHQEILAGRPVQGANVSQPESRSVTGNLVIAANDIISFLGGSDFFAAVRQGGVTQMSGVNTGVAQLNQKLAELRNVSPPGTRIEVYPQGALVAVLATNRPLPQGPR